MSTRRPRTDVTPVATLGIARRALVLALGTGAVLGLILDAFVSCVGSL